MASITYESLSARNIRVKRPTASGVVLITLSRSKIHNALTVDMLEDLIQAVTLVNTDEKAKCAVFTGEGKAFCTGVDLSLGFGEIGRTPEEHRDAGGQLVLAIHQCRKPTIAAIQGSAVGIGITMTLPMSIRIAASDAKIGFVFARRGIVADAASSFYLPRLVGYSRAIHLFTTGSVHRADSSIFGDLFSDILLRQSDVLPRALQLAEEIAINTSQVSTYINKELVLRGPSSPEETHLLDSRILHQVYETNDCKEGIAAFMEKRQPVFTDTLEKSRPTGLPWWSAKL